MGVYSHVTQPMIDAMRAGLQHRWEQTREHEPMTTFVHTVVVKIVCSQMLPETINGLRTVIVCRPLTR
ncbi:hypothetical protein A6A25_33440 [Saccharothrix sp. CB00851]|nr:hypothetical protein A6A25_33440 [Saccharothrix sp. CB00851]